MLLGYVSLNLVGMIHVLHKAILPFHGRLSFKHYMKDEPTEAFVLSDARNGLCLPHVNLYRQECSKEG